MALCAATRKCIERDLMKAFSRHTVIFKIIWFLSFVVHYTHVKCGYPGTGRSKGKIFHSIYYVTEHGTSHIESTYCNANDCQGQSRPQLLERRKPHRGHKHSSRIDIMIKTECRHMREKQKSRSESKNLTKITTQRLIEQINRSRIQAPRAM